MKIIDENDVHGNYHFFFVIIPFLRGLHRLWQAVMKLACDAHVKCDAKLCLRRGRRGSGRRAISPAKLIHKWDSPRLNQHPGWWDLQCHLDPGFFCSALSLGFCESLLGLRAININSNFGGKLNSPFTNVFTPDQCTALLESPALACHLPE